MKHATLLSLATFALLLLAASVHAETYQVDPVHSTILFRIHHMGAGQFWGRFNEPKGTINWDKEDPSKSTLEVSVESKNLDTHIAKRDQDLAGPDFFNSKQYPQLSFKSSSVKKTGDNMYEVTGDMTIKGITKPLTAQVEMTGIGKNPRGNAVAGWEATFTVNRADFGVTGLPQGLGNDVKIIVSLEAGEKK